MHNFHPKSVQFFSWEVEGAYLKIFSGGGALVQGNIKIKQIIAK